jgi:beta-galactosidase
MANRPSATRPCLGLLLLASLLFHQIAGAQPGPSTGPQTSPRMVESFDRGWKFHLGEAPGAEQPAFDDSAWRAVDLPHDWMIEGVPGADPSKMEGPFDPKSPAGPGGGYLNGGIGWYRKTFTVPDTSKGKRVSILFDGAYMDVDIYLNGQKLGNHPYGFTSFFFDLTPGLKFGAQENVVAVRLNVQQPCCRWYSGAGLYRHVWLTTTEPLHLATWGIYITTPEATATGARVAVKTQLENAGAGPAEAKLTTILLDPGGQEVGRAEQSGLVAAGGSTGLSQDFTLPSAQLWSPDSPVLYHAVSELRLNGALVDSTTTPFGIRHVEFTTDQGLLLNGRHVEIHGVCDHHDLGCLGSVALRRGFQRQLEILKTMGCNALRTSHNPPSPELLDLCDQMGFLVMDECFDEWKQNKTKYGYARFFDDWSQKDLASMLDRDRNHPCIILWSIGNEIPDGRSPKGAIEGRPLVDLCHREDPSRPVTAAVPSPEKSVKVGFDKILDVFGINYDPAFYTDPGVRGVEKLFGSETASTADSRGEYGLTLDAAGNIQAQIFPDRKVHQMPDYDHWYPPWGSAAETEEIALQNDPWVAGEFMWTGFDYIGEPTPYPWPSRSSYFGAIDLCGFPKDRFYMYQSQWSSRPMVHLMPHWTWPGFEGKPISVRVYSNADTVELFLNGRSLGAKHLPADAERVELATTLARVAVVEGAEKPTASTMPKQKVMEDNPSVHLAWTVPYAPGELKAVASKDGKVVATDVVHTAGAPARLALEADRTQIAGNGQDLSFIKVSILDQDGNVCPNAADEIHFQLAGDAAALAGVDDGDAINHESFQGTQHSAYHGLALAVIKSHFDQAGAVTLSASAAGLAPASVEIKVAGTP